MSCDGGINITMINSEMDYIAATYSAAQIQDCIANKTLKDSLSVLGGLAFDDGQLQALKNNLNTVRLGTFEVQLLFLYF